MTDPQSSKVDDELLVSDGIFNDVGMTLADNFMQDIAELPGHHRIT